PTCQMVSPARACTSAPSSVNAMVSPPAPSPCTLSAGPVCATFGRPSTFVSPPAAPFLSWPYPTGSFSLLIESPLSILSIRHARFRGDDSGVSHHHVPSGFTKTSLKYL